MVHLYLFLSVSILEIANNGITPSEAVGGMIIGRGNGSKWTELTPVPLCPPQIPPRPGTPR
jgi:hypothetical protein